MSEATVVRRPLGSGTSGAFSRGFKILAWSAIVGLAVYFYYDSPFKYFSLTQEAFGAYWPKRGWLLFHIGGGTLALFMGPFQFWTGLRRKHMKVHRWTGRMYLSGVGVGSLGAFYLAATTDFGWSWGVGLAFLAVAWLTTSGMALLAIKLRDFDQHKQWMIRSYVVTFAFVTFRLVDKIPAFVNLGSFPERGAMLIWASWVVPLLMAEVVIQSRTMLKDRSLSG